MTFSAHTVGLVTEYNPFHNGHLHHLRESLRVTGAAASVAVMSGHFLQRGEPALVDKWVRTEMALAAGVDLVLELPFPFACNSAPCFALGAVKSLNALGIVDALCFGSESGALGPLQSIARLLVERADEIAGQTARRLRCGVSYPAARAEVLAALAPDLPSGLLASPRAIFYCPAELSAPGGGDAVRHLPGRRRPGRAPDRCSYDSDNLCGIECCDQVKAMDPDPNPAAAVLCAVAGAS